MAFPDIGPGPEIDNELILFRELFNIRRNYRNSLLISQGGRITQHLVEFLARNKIDIDEDIYKSDFKVFLDKCEFIPDAIRDFILIINNYRKEVVHSLKYEEELGEVMLSFLETFNEVLIWFEYYCRYEFNTQYKKFRQIERTRKFLDQKIEKQKQTGDNFNEYKGPETILVEKSPDEIIELIAHLPEICDAVKDIQRTTHDMISTVHEINDTTHDTNRTVQDIDNNVKNLLIEFKQMNESLNDIQKKYEKKLENEYSDEKIENILTEFSDRCVIKIRDSIEKKVIGTEDYKKEEEKLIEYLGEPAWNKLEDRSKTFLTTSKITFNRLNDLGDVIDYSGVCLLVTKALERELTKRFYKGFIDYLKGKYNKNYNEYHTSLLSQNPKNKDYYVKKPKYWSLGGIPYILGFIEHNDPEINEKNISRLIEYSKNELFTGLNDEEIKETLYEYGSQVYDITKKYRNRAAHVNELKKLNAEECFAYVIEAQQVLKIMLDSFDK